MTRIRTIALNTSVVLGSLLAALIACEIAARLVLNPADVLSVTMEAHPVLGIEVAPDSAGFDRWGFRNPKVPEGADVVTLGDSHTFGNTARMEDSWPRVFARQTGLDVYNLALGGYGPNQYYHLMKTRALSLHPKHVLCGVYLGDDFENAYSITYGLEYWKFLRTRRAVPVDADIWGDAEAPGAFKGARNWLSRRSMVYRLTVHSPGLAAIKGALQLYQARGHADASVTTLADEEHGISEAFRPLRVAAGLNQSREEVREGMRITFDLLKEMDDLCRNAGCSFTVVLIPTKETVFADDLKAEPDLHLKDAVDSIIANERTATVQLKQFLERSGIEFVDARPALVEARAQALYYPGPADMHPNRNGYRVIGEAVARSFQDRVVSR
jgi:hypothetical protein